MKHQSRSRVCGKLLAVGASVVLGSGCTHFAASRSNANLALEEHSRALTTAVVDVLERQPEARRDEFSTAALEFARVDQEIEGFPLEMIPVGELTGATNLTAAARARGKFEEQIAEIRNLRGEERRAGERLLAFGARFEQEQNRARLAGLKWFGGGSLLIGGLVALLVFVPASAPIIARIVAWLAGRIPALAGSAGVVSLKAFDAVVKAVERTRRQGEGPVQTLGNETSAAPFGVWHDLQLNLSREMDAAHKSLVRQRKQALGL